VRRAPRQTSGSPSNQPSWIDERRLSEWRGNKFKVVEEIGRTLPDVEVTTTWGQPTLKVRKKMFVCIASHPSAEPDTLVVMMDFPDRDALIEEDPATYYLKEHYVGYPCVLVRLARVHPDALRDLVIGAHRYVSQKSRKAGRARKLGIRK
jgi:hypothetical protein